jgi:hypothetical protein
MSGTRSSDRGSEVQDREFAQRCVGERIEEVTRAKAKSKDEQSSLESGKRGSEHEQREHLGAR